jgi:hypothetical protein
MTALRRNQVVSSFIAITPALGVLMLLTCDVSYAAQQTIEWFDELSCSYKIRFDPRKYDEQGLRNTVDLIFVGRMFEPLLPEIPMRPESLSNFSLENFQQFCERTIRQVSDLPVIELPGIAAYRKLKIEELDDECRFGTIKARAALGDPAALRTYAPSAPKCSRFIDGLEGKADIMTVWREMVSANCQRNSSPSTCRADFLSDEGKPDAMDRIRLLVLQYGWNNCSTAYLRVADRKQSEKMRLALVREFVLRFKIKKSVCSD